MGFRTLRIQQDSPHRKGILTYFFNLYHFLESNSRLKQLMSALRQVAKHTESAGSQLVMHSKVSSEHSSPQTLFSSTSLKVFPANAIGFYPGSILTDIWDQRSGHFGQSDKKTPHKEKITRRLSFFIFSLRFYLQNSRFFSQTIFSVKYIPMNDDQSITPR